MSADRVWLFLHVLGFTLWVGVAVTTAFLAARARRAGNPSNVAFAYRASSQLMKTLGLVGMVLTVGAGFLLTAARDHPFFQPFPEHWLFQMQLLGSLAFLVGVLYQVPLADRLARAAEASAEAGEESEAFRKYRKRNAVLGSVVGTVLLLIVLLGTLQP